MEIAKKQEIAEALKGWHDPNDTERSFKVLSAKTNVNTSYMSLMSRGLHETPNKSRGAGTPIPDAAYYSLAEALGVSTQTDVHLPTKSYVKGYNACSYAQRTARRVLMDGDSGSGKTYLLERYAKENDKVLYVKCTSRMKGRDLIQRIIDLLGIRTDKKSDSGKISEIARKVLGVKGYLIIIDEAESVSKDIYRVIKDLEDATYRKCGMVLCGMGLKGELEAGAKRRAKLMPQLLRRFRGNVCLLESLENGNKRAKVRTACSQ